ncbi:hypothetical protein WH91_22060 [Devosia psychrophila]|jgi:hypothetical protein|uniref:Uncharacterized protein n=1 Tax=Devosia psychrophila TaxID=728005 RepID=A0A0F5PQU5_9HYPH|nr:hypothetical protein WH91_22060 [Devosia psychrophila]SFC98583.1 hypothetical protein SAMN04488059_11699 [Devosia psychrophila]
MAMTMNPMMRRRQAIAVRAVALMTLAIILFTPKIELAAFNAPAIMSLSLLQSSLRLSIER